MNDTQHGLHTLKKDIKSISSYDCAVEQSGPEAHRGNITVISGDSMGVELDR